MPIVPPNWNLPESIRNRISPTTYGRQRAIVEERQIVLVLHKPPGAHDASRQGVLFWRDGRGEWQGSRGGSGSGSGLLKRHVQEYAALEASLTERYEAATTSTELFDVLGELIPIARAARNGYAALQSAREEFGDDPFLLELRDLAGDVDRECELLLEDVRGHITYRTVREAEEQARLAGETLRASHRLNLLAALFLPVTAVAGVFGMNLASGLPGDSPALFWIVLVVAVSLGVALVLWILGRAGAASRLR